MAKKAAKTKKTATAKMPTKPSHVPTPWLKLKQMWEAGESYEAMAKATDAHYDPKKPDPTKATRAKIWKARNQGVNIDGKLVKFGARGKTGSGTAKKGKPGKPVKKGSGKVKAKTTGKAEANIQPVASPEPAKNAEQE